MLDEALIAYAVKYEGGLVELQQAGITRDHFVDSFKTVYTYLLRSKTTHDAIPSADTLCGRFPDLVLPRVRRRELPILLQDIRKRYKFIRLLTLMNSAADSAVNFDVVDDVIQRLQGDLNNLGFEDSGSSHLVDLFSAEVTDLMRQENRKRRRGEVIGIPTGLEKFDTLAGGLQKQKMVVAIGRPGIGKSWLDLLFVANAIISGHSFMLYPLEMTLVETAHRLYTLFSSRLFGADRAIKNFDLTHGKVNTRKFVRFLNLMEDRFAGSLHIADVGSLSDPYTVERIEAEVELHGPDGFWVDYITLLKPPPGANGAGDDGWGAVRALSHGIKNTAMRRNCVGGCSAQVNRQALNSSVFLPRLEHIAYGDSIGQDADMVFSLNRTKQNLYYALVKNRGGLEIGKTKLSFGVNSGVIGELADDPQGELEAGEED